MGEKGEGLDKYRLVVTEQSWGHRVQPREYSQEYSNNYAQYQMGTRVIGRSLSKL